MNYYIIKYKTNILQGYIKYYYQTKHKNNNNTLYADYADC